MKIETVFSDGMVLQRGKINTLKGWIKTGNAIVCRVRDEVKDWEKEVDADGNGRFEIVLPGLPAGKEFEITLREITGENRETVEAYTIKNAVYGDVFLLGGQSNMELPVYRTLDVTSDQMGKDYPMIRQFRVPMEYNFDEPAEHMQKSAWVSAVGNTTLEFSAAGYFMARELYAKYGVPIGLILTAIGGTPIQAWCSSETIHELGDYEKELEIYRQPGYIEGVQEFEQNREREWHMLAEEAVRGTACTREHTLTVPGLWKNNEKLNGFCGSLILEKDVWFEGKESKDAMIYMGTIVDADKIYVNDVPVGGTEYCYPPRKYQFDAECLKIGKNTIRIEMLVFRKKGGFIPDKPYYIECGKERHELSGVWNYSIGKEMEPLEETTFFQYKPTGLLNGMVGPIAGYPVKGMAFYQGESNDSKPEEYKKYFMKAVGDWRKLWESQQLPVVYVQLAGFADSEPDCREENWAVLRQQQLECLEAQDTAMVTAIDIGEYNDLHPQDKLTLGKRLALAMEGMAYKEDIVYSGPIIKSCIQEGSCLRLFFSHIGGGLRIKGEQASGFELAGIDGKYKAAHAWIADNTVIAECEEVDAPVFCRYAWNNCPKDISLYNKEGLPASPFMIKKE